MNATVNYANIADKQRLYVAATIPLIFAQALAAPVVFAGAKVTPAQLHEWIRAKAYVAEDGPQDEVRDVPATLTNGGDCEDWAAVIGAYAQQNGWPWRIVTAGDDLDNFQHVYAEVFSAGRWIPMDPKGSQRGLDYGSRGDFPVRRTWSLDVSRQPREVRGSGCAKCNNSDAASPRHARQANGSGLARQSFSGGGCAQCNDSNSASPRVSGSGADYLDLQAAQIKRVIRQLGKSSAWEVEMLDGRITNVARQLVERFRAREAAGVLPGTTQQQVNPALLPPGVRVVPPAPVAVSDNKFVAAWIVSKLPRQQLVQVTDAMGVVGDDAQRAGALADALVLMAAAADKPVRDLGQFAGVAIPSQDDPASGSGGLFDKIGQKFEDIGEVAQQKLRAVQTGVGVGLQQVGRGIVALSEKAPWANQFFFKPLGIHLIGTAVAELGDAVKDGSLSTFDEKRLTYSMASWFKAVGQALTTAAPFTGPWAPLFAAAGAANVAIGQTIKTLVDNHAARRLGSALDVSTTVQVDAYGRQIDAQGNLVDPVQRDLAARQQAQPQLQLGADGRYYGYLNFAEFGPLWTAFEVNTAGQPVPRAAYIAGERRWAEVR